MAIEVSRREVLNNLIRFKDALLELHVRQKAGDGQTERVYRVLLNRRTGDMRFARKISSLEHHFQIIGKGASEDWTQARLIVTETSDHHVHFEVKDIKETDLEPLAWRISSETVKVLNIKGHEVHEVSSDQLPEEMALADLSGIHCATQGERMEDFPGWAGSLSRMGAEAKLQGKPEGAFLIREAEPITRAMAQALSLSNHLGVNPYVLTVVAEEMKISEVLILQTDKGWMIYEDEPRLALCVFYPSLHTLFQALRSIARHSIS